MHPDLTIRALEKPDYPAWLPVWDANNQHRVGPDITQATWQRLHAPDTPFRALGAFVGGKLVGILHAVLHPVTGAVNPVCYMQDLFVLEDYRRQGIARALVLALAALGQRENWHRLYWLAEAQNIPAQNFYQSFGVKLDFTLHALPIAS